ncbi:MAG: hypothetical protein F7O42_11190 [Opitutae bacterium]|nr:hypothetical protein [Opitutae bacterium]
MNTWFEILIRDADEHYARQAAAEAFREIDRLETVLSKFREGSDIDILNKRAAGEPVRVSAECWDCLLHAMDLEILTRGVFSIAFASFMDLERFGGKLPVGSWMEMDPEYCTVRFRYPDIEVDLGGIGKGHALDLVVNMLTDWEIAGVLIHSGTSTVVAKGDDGVGRGWPVTIGADKDPWEIRLEDRSLSGSGLFVRGSHILNLDTQTALNTSRRAWAMAGIGAHSDALSTSFMMMSPPEVDRLC